MHAVQDAIENERLIVVSGMVGAGDHDTPDTFFHSRLVNVKRHLHIAHLRPEAIHLLWIRRRLHVS